MIADTIFLSDYLKERRKSISGPASQFLAEHRRATIRTTIISVGEIAVLFPSSQGAFDWLEHWKIYPLSRGVVLAAADIDRAMKAKGDRLGENDNWIAGFACFYREPIISHDEAFDRVPGIRRISYHRSALERFKK